MNDAYSDFIYRFVEAINFIAPSKKIRVKANSKPWFDNQIVLAIQRRDKLYKKFKHSCLETDKDNLNKDRAIQFEALENANTFKSFYSELAGGLQEKLPRAPSKFTSQTTKNYYAKYWQSF